MELTGRVSLGITDHKWAMIVSTGMFDHESYSALSAKRMSPTPATGMSGTLCSAFFLEPRQRMLWLRP